MTEYTEKQKEYIKKLRGVDWFACMSDDGRVALRGRTHERAVKKEGEADPETQGMYQKYHDYMWKREAPDPFADA